MKIQLYVYDLSRGLARSMSRQFLGIQIDAVYHTSLVFGNIEYFFGAGVQTAYPGSTHHGQPMEVVEMGNTELPLEVILEYLDSLKKVYTPESYDLFAHNCNNFTNDFAMFLVGKGIPGHITSLPATVLNTPFGQMLRPQIDRAMRPVTQAPTPQIPVPSQSTANQLAKHQHESLEMPIFLRQSTQPVLYSKISPLDKLSAKIKSAGADMLDISKAVDFIRARNDHGSQEASLPDLENLASHFQDYMKTLPVDAQFAIVDLWRMVVVDPRACSFFAQNQESVLFLVNHIIQQESCPYNLQLTAVQFCCNLFASTVPVSQILKTRIVELVSNALLDKEHPILRAAASSLAFNVATGEYYARTIRQAPTNFHALQESSKLELAASLIEVLNNESESPEVVRGIALSLARLLYKEPKESELYEVYTAMEAGNSIKSRTRSVKAEDKGLFLEIQNELFQKGLQ